MDNLGLLCRRDHRRIDVHRWEVSLDPTSAVMTWTHPLSRRTYRTVPHGTRPPPRLADDLGLPGWLAPPIPEVPPDDPPPDPPEVSVDDHPPWARPPDG